MRRESVILQPEPGEMARNVLCLSPQGQGSGKDALGVLQPRGPRAGNTLPPPLGAPGSSVFEDHIELAWEPPAGLRRKPAPPKVAGYNIYRSEGGEAAGPPELGAADGSRIPRTATFPSAGPTAILSGRPPPRLPSPSESEDSEPSRSSRRTPSLPPRPPGLTARSPAPDFITLSWERGPGSPTWPATGSGGAPPARRRFLLLQELSPAESSFSDTDS